MMARVIIGIAYGFLSFPLGLTNHRCYLYTNLLAYFAFVQRKQVFVYVENKHTEFPFMVPYYDNDLPTNEYVVL